MENSTLIKNILDRGYLMTLATCGTAGVGACELIYVPGDDGVLFWLSHPATRHSQAIAENPRVAATVTLSNTPADLDEGLQIEGVARKYDGDATTLLLKLQSKRKKPAPGSAAFDYKGRVWYVLYPSKIEVIHEKLFGYTKQIVTI